MKVRFKQKMDVPDGTVIRFHVQKNGEWLQVGDAKYNAATEEVEVEFDPNTENGKIMTETLGSRVDPGAYSINGKAI